LASLDRDDATLDPTKLPQPPSGHAAAAPPSSLMNSRRFS